MVVVRSKNCGVDKGRASKRRSGGGAHSGVEGPLVRGSSSLKKKAFLVLVHPQEWAI